jgi:signal transduction histidine kinase
MNGARWLLRAGFLAALAGAAALTAGGGRAIQQDVEATYRQDLRRLEALDAQLARELLRSRSGLVMHYDALTRTYQDLRRTSQRLVQVPASLGFDAGAALTEELGRVNTLVGSLEILLDRFKSDNAILRNSRQYYPVLLDEARVRLEAVPNADRVERRLGAVLGALAHFDVAPARDAVARLSLALEELRTVGLPSVHSPASATRVSPASPSELHPAAALAASAIASELDLIQKHGALIIQRSASVDQLVAQALGVPLEAEIARASASYEESYRAALRRGQSRATWLTALIAAAIVLGLIEVIARSLSVARSLREARDELERANRALDHERAREREQNELKTRFVSATSHEFRTPLTTILSSSQMLATYGERWGSERRMRHFERISTAASHMTQMLEELLLIGRAEMGVLSASAAALDLQDFCRELIETLAPATQQGEGGHAVDLAFEGESDVELDRRLLTHVLGNLLENALKYSEPGGAVGLAVSVVREGVRCVVSDTGMGIPASDLPHLFDSFYRGQNAGTVAGSGLGLAVVKRAVDVQGGTIEVQSEPGRGTRVTVWLPLGTGPSGAESERLASSAATGVAAPAGPVPRTGSSFRVSLGPQYVFSVGSVVRDA